MPDAWYLVAVLATVFAITFGLRALPFAMLQPLRDSVFVSRMAIWMPVGILAILMASTFGDTVGVDPLLWLHGTIAIGVTVLVHLTLGRRTLLSVGLGTLTFVLLVNLVG